VCIHAPTIHATQSLPGSSKSLARLSGCEYSVDGFDGVDGVDAIPKVCNHAFPAAPQVEYDGGDVSEAGNRNGGSCSYIFSSIRNLSEIRITELHYHANSPARLDDAQTDRGESVLYLDVSLALALLLLLSVFTTLHHRVIFVMLSVHA